MFYFFFNVSDAISPSKGNTRNIKKLEERKTDPLSLEGYVSSTTLPKPPEKGKGGCLQPLSPGAPGTASQVSISGHIRDAQPPMGPKEYS